MFQAIKTIESPEEIKAKLPLPAALAAIKRARDAQAAAVIRGEDKRLMLIVGPCSAHDPVAVVEFIRRLGVLQERVAERLLLIPRIYTGKPRTKGEGYKGIYHQPDPLKPPDLEAGVIAVRNMHIRAIEASGLTSADEMLYPDNYAYMDDLLTYVTIGARSSENQQHRLVGSGVEVPLGVKNPMHGSLSVLLNSVYSTQLPNEFKYNSVQVRTQGNPLSHAVLRGYVDDNGVNFANYHYEDVVKFTELYARSGLANPAIVIDTNHSNSGKDPLQQPRIVREVLTNRAHSASFGKFIRGFMIESFLEDGRQSIDDNVFGKSITDACLGWKKTERLILDAAEQI